jgi:hypothetical protein
MTSLVRPGTTFMTPWVRPSDQFMTPWVSTFIRGCQLSWFEENSLVRGQVEVITYNVLWSSVLTHGDIYAEPGLTLNHGVIYSAAGVTHGVIHWSPGLIHGVINWSPGLTYGVPVEYK